jgi:oligosaccharide repeat unit polymerase
MYDYFFTNSLLAFLDVLSLTTIALTVLIRNYRSPQYYSVWSPTTIISLLVLYYMVINPVLLVLAGNTTYGGVPMEDSLTVAWTAGLVSYLSVLLGFKFYSKRPKTNLFYFHTNDKALFKTGIALFLIALGGWVYTRGFQLNVFQVDKEREFVTGGLSSYLTQAIAFMVASIVFIVMSILSKPVVYLREKIVFIVLTLASLLTFITQGSRYRIVILVIAAAGTYYLKKKKKPNLVLWAGLGALFFLAMGVIEVTRNYSRGLDIDRLQNYEISDIGSNAQNETKIFFFSGKVIEVVEKKSGFIYLEPFITALLMPFPRAIFPDKPDGAYLKEIQLEVFGSSDRGAAFMFFAEYFYAFGWLGLVVFSALLGSLCKYFYLNYFTHRDRPTAILSLALFNGLIFIIISRGYLAQQVFSYFYFLVIPFWTLRFYSNRK